MRGNEPSRRWFLVTDGCRARIVVPDAEEGRFHVMMALGVAEPPHYPPPLPGEDALGIFEEFATEVASSLSRAAEEYELGEFFLVAPYSVARAICKALPADVAPWLRETLPWEHVALDDDALSAHLARWWSPPPDVSGLTKLLAVAGPTE